METSPQIIRVKDQRQGLNYAKDILYRKSDNQTLLFLSGGSTPKELYQTLAQEKRLKGKAVGMVDERADKSNFEMIEKTGLLTYLKSAGISFYPITSSRAYDKTIRSLIKSSENKIAIMGIGTDGHTASLAAGTQISNLKTQNYVTKVTDFPAEPRERITLTLNALSEMDLLIILAFGEGKKKALKLMFDEGSIEEIPARFYLRWDIACKTILITDQKM